MKKRRKLRLPRETVRQLTPLPPIRVALQCTDSCDTCPSLAFTCINTCTTP